jgi:predicted MFS family arabinose efflux permease
MGGGVSVIIAYLPLYTHQRLGFSEEAAGSVAGVVGLTALVFGIIWSRSSQRFESLLIPLAMIAALAVPSPLLLAATPALAGWLVWIAAVAAGATAVAWNATGMLAVVSTVGAERAGHASGQVLFGFYGGFVLTPPVFGYAVDRLGTYAPGWTAVAFLFAFAAVSLPLRDRDGGVQPSM